MAATEALIVGGGISGLYTAFKLQKAGVPYVLLEAKSILGGRVAGEPALPDSHLSVDLGPTWFWAHQNNLKQLLTELHLEWFEQYSEGETLYHMHPEERPSRTYSSPGTMTSYRVKGGMQNLIAGLMEKVEQTSINTEHGATTIRKNTKIWQVTAVHHDRQRTFEAHQLVLALPPRQIIKHLTPQHYLSKKLIKDLQVQQTWMAGQAKFAALYNKPFWREKNLSGQAFSQVGPMVEIHDASSTQDSGFALFGFIGLSAAARSQFSNEQLRSQCVAQLGVLFGPEALDTEASYLKDWAQDKWVATDQDSNELPRHAHFNAIEHRDELESLQLHLAASECSQFEAGYLEGALLAAGAAAHGVESCMPGDSTSIL